MLVTHIVCFALCSLDHVDTVKKVLQIFTDWGKINKKRRDSA